MPIEIVVPRLGWSMEEGAFVAWLKKDGEFVRAGEPLFSIEGDKAVQEIESIDSGTLRIVANGPQPGSSIHVGDLLGHLLSEGESTSNSPPTAVVASPPATPQPPPLSHPVPLTEDERPQVQSAGQPAISPRALRVAAELGIDWTKVGGTGRTGRIRERDVRAAAGADPSNAAAWTPTRGTTPTILVTGGCGFIGTWVVRELLQRGLRVVVLDVGERPARWERVIGAAGKQVPIVQGSLLDRGLLARLFADHRVAHVIHLAALLTPACQADPWEGCRLNVLGSVALFEQVRLCADRIQGFSYASSVAVFGDEPGLASGPAAEGEHPLTFYGAFKRSVELIAQQYWRQFKIPSVGIRPQVAYGPERDVGLTAGPSLAARAAACGEAFCINYTGRVGYDYVEDVARAFVRGALETPAGAPVVDLPGEIADVAQVLAAIAAAAPEGAPKLSVEGPPLAAQAPGRPRFISTLYPDWKTTPLAEGIRQTVEFYRVKP